MSPEERLREAEAEVARWKRIIESKSCAEGHTWVSDGGASAGCCDDCNCSVPVHVCSVCGDCDYGDNDEAREVRRECAEWRAEQEEA